MHVPERFANVARPFPDRRHACSPPAPRWPRAISTPAGTRRRNPPPGSPPARASSPTTRSPASPEASAFWYRGDSLMKKRDYDGAIAAFSAALDADPDNVGYLNSRGIAYSNKGDEEHALADYELCLQLRPNFASAYNNRGVIFLRRGDFDRALEEFNAAVKIASNSPTRYAPSLQPRPRADLSQAIRRRACRFRRGAKSSIPMAPQVPNYRCITYTEMGKFDEALADCNAVLAKSPKVDLHADQPRPCLSRQGRSRRRAQRLQRGDQDQPELYPRPRRPRPALRETQRPRRRARRLSGRERRR